MDALVQKLALLSWSRSIAFVTPPAYREGAVVGVPAAMKEWPAGAWPSSVAVSTPGMASPR
ncbi:hypothetical protein [Actinomadura alba]|uniref:Uncharacterized protein n=1 Tax=Actinomadura alba TaxID=406431 RepID=A0ABR7LU72_9ACTN|nr:hypothetical protein [Actinomadura alba]MBC6468398.1 hypothetical protein [Actinomadura alba]